MGIKEPPLFSNCISHSSDYKLTTVSTQIYKDIPKNQNQNVQVGELTIILCDFMNALFHLCATEHSSGLFLKIKFFRKIMKAKRILQY